MGFWHVYDRNWSCAVEVAAEVVRGCERVKMQSKSMAPSKTPGKVDLFRQTIQTAADIYQLFAPHPLQDATGLQMSLSCLQMLPDASQVPPRYEKIHCLGSRAGVILAWKLCNLDKSGMDFMQALPIKNYVYIYIYIYMYISFLYFIYMETPDQPPQRPIL